MTIIDLAKRHYRDLPSHVKERQTAKILHAIVVEVEQLEAENKRLRAMLDVLHDWMLKKAPEHYCGCGLFYDVSAQLGRNESEATE